MTDQPPIGTPSVNVPPSPAQTGRSWVRLLLIGGGGCLMLIAVQHSGSWRAESGLEAARIGE